MKRFVCRFILVPLIKRYWGVALAAAAMKGAMEGAVITIIWPDGATWLLGEASRVYHNEEVGTD